MGDPLPRYLTTAQFLLHLNISRASLYRDHGLLDCRVTLGGVRWDRHRADAMISLRSGIAPMGKVA